MTTVASIAVRRDVPEGAAARARLLQRIVAGLGEQSLPVDAIVLPGGFFQCKGSFLKMTPEERCVRLENAPFAKEVQNAADALASLANGAMLVFGVDTGGFKAHSGDQLCVAWSAKGPEGVGRKVFPTEWEGNHDFVVSAHDFAEESGRLVTIGGDRVLLCSCYDGYGVYNSPSKDRFIKHLYAEGRELSRHADGKRFREALRRGLEEWRKLVDKADAAAMAIHKFEEGGNASYWRRHGIATASAALNGGWAVAGAHFETMPGNNADALASFKVPKRHLQMGNGRPADDATPLCEYREGESVRVQVFEF